MGNAAILQQPDIFAANRARGLVAISAGASAGVTRRTTVREEGSLRVRFPGPVAPALQAVIVNTAGGTAGGDRYDIACHAGAGADLTVSTTAAEKVYRSIGADAEVSIRLTVETGGNLTWLPQETIFFDDARLSRRIDVASEKSELGALAGVLNNTFARLESAFQHQVRFTADASHELRTPLSVIHTHAQLALSRERSAEDNRKTIEK